MRIQIESASVPSTELPEVNVPVSITLKALADPTSVAPMWAMRATVFYATNPYNGTAPTVISLSPASKAVTAVGDQETFTGSFAMPSTRDIKVTFAVEYIDAVGGTWTTESFSEGYFVTRTQVAPTPAVTIDLSTIIGLMMVMMVIAVMSGMFAPKVRK